MIVTIELQDMEFRAFHGCYQTEKMVGNRFKVQLVVDAEVGDSPTKDDVTQSLNYLDLYAVVDREMRIVSDIIENVALRIANALKGEFSQIVNIQVKVCKLAPPLGGKVAAVCATVKM